MPFLVDEREDLSVGVAGLVVERLTLDESAVALLADEVVRGDHALEHAGRVRRDTQALVGGE